MSLRVQTEADKQAARPVLWHSNAPWARTGYGTQTRLFAPRIHTAGYHTAVSAFFGLNGGTVEMNGIRVYPGGYDGYGGDVIAPNAEHHFAGRRGMVVTLIDVWVLPVDVLKGLDVAMWTPVDHDPAPPAVVQTLEKSGAVPIAMSRFGEAQLREAGLDPLYVPHAVDTKVYKPRPKAEARRGGCLRGFPPDAYIVGMVAANKGRAPARKGWDQALQAFARLRKDNKNAYLYLHTEPFGRLDGVHLPSLLHALEVPEEAVRFPDPYRYGFTGFGDDEMVDLFSGIDVLLNPALGEGFGLPVLEAAACGTPSIVTACTAMPEVGEHGWHASGVRTWTQQRSFQTVPDVDELVSFLKDAEHMAGQMAEVCVEHAARYDIRRVLDEHMLPALAECGRRFDARRDERDPARQIDTTSPVQVEAAV